MNLECGFRRLLIALSVAALVAGIALDAGKLWSHAKIYATLDNGRTEIIEAWNPVGSAPSERDASTKQMVESLLYAVAKKQSATCQRPPCIPLDPEVVKTIRVVRGPRAWSWEDFFFIRIAGSVVVLLWVGFFGVRWVAKGFTS